MLLYTKSAINSDLQAPLHRHANIGRRTNHLNARRFQRGDFTCRSAFAAGHDRAGMAHALAGRRGLSGDIGNHGLGDMRFDVIGRILFLAAADFADHDYTFGLLVFLKTAQHVDEIHAVYRIAADADASALAQALRGSLMHRFISQRTGARDDAD